MNISSPAITNLKGKCIGDNFTVRLMVFDTQYQIMNAGVIKKVVFPIINSTSAIVDFSKLTIKSICGQDGLPILANITNLRLIYNDGNTAPELVGDISSSLLDGLIEEAGDELTLMPVAMLVPFYCADPDDVYTGYLENLTGFRILIK